MKRRSLVRIHHPLLCGHIKKKKKKNLDNEECTAQHFASLNSIENRRRVWQKQSMFPQGPPLLYIYN
jgi:hypothetical protein